MNFGLFLNHLPCTLSCSSARFVTQNAVIRRIRRRRRQYILRNPRVICPRDNPLTFYNPDQIFVRYRFKPQTILILVGLLEEAIKHKTEMNSALPPLLMVCVALRFFGSGSFQTCRRHNPTDITGNSIQMFWSFRQCHQPALKHHIPSFRWLSPPGPTGARILRHCLYAIAALYKLSSTQNICW